MFVNYNMHRILLSILILIISCQEKSSTDATDSSNDVFSAQLLNQLNVIESARLVDCELEDGTDTKCYKIVFKSNPVDNGPYCPSTINDIGGVGIYDGQTNPGFQIMDSTLWNAMEADGYDIIDDNGNINILDPGNLSGPPPSAGTAACLEATPNENLQLTYYIPAVPKLSSNSHVLNIVEDVGVSIDGIPYKGHPPSVVHGPPGMGSGGGIPSIDPCGGHVDPFGYYHLHFSAEEMNNVLSSNNITKVECINFTQNSTAFIGYAKDGYPIYTSRDNSDTLPSDLDDCQGHTSPTMEYPDGIYHYHTSSDNAPNLPTCLKGVAVKNSFSYNQID
jgi:hypothetical protein